MIDRQKRQNSVIIDCVSDLHGYYPKLEGGDLLIVAGDLTAKHTEKEWHEFSTWMNDQKYEKIIFIAGNHDTMIEKWDHEQDAEGYKGPVSDPNDRIEYLCDSGTEFEGLKIWGSPWSPWFSGINPKCTAFTGNEEDLSKAYEKIPSDTDILITHTPPYGILDKCKKGHVGSESLRNQMFRIKPKLLIFGHIHECGGTKIDLVSTICVNASIVNERYEHVNKPIQVIL